MSTDNKTELNKVGYNAYHEEGIVTTKPHGDNPYLSKLKRMIYNNYNDKKNNSQCHPLDKDKTSMLNTGVTRNQKDTSSNHTYNNSLFNNNFNM